MVRVAERVPLRQRRGNTGVPDPVQANPNTLAGLVAMAIPAGLELGDVVVEDRPSQSSLCSYKGKKKGKGVKRLVLDNEVTEGEDLAKRRYAPSSSAVEVDAPTVRSPTKVVGTVFESESSYTALFAGVGCPGLEFPYLDSLLGNKAYSDVAQQLVKFIAAMNSLVLDYESDVRSATFQIDVLKKKVKGFKARGEKTERRIKDLNCIVDTHCKKYEALESKNMELESDLAASRAQVDDLTVRLAESNQLQRAKVQKAIHDANCAMVAKFGERMALAKAKIDDMMSSPLQRLLDYTEVKCNLELIAQIRDETLVPPFDIGEEEASLLLQKKKLDEANTSFVDFVTDLEQLLEFPLGEMEFSEMVELAAESVGAGSDGGVALAGEQVAEEMVSSPTASTESAGNGPSDEKDADEDVAEDVAEDMEEDVVADTASSVAAV